MRTSLTRKLIFVFSAILLAVLVLNIAINAFLLNRVHTNRKLDSMETLYSTLYEKYSQDAATEQIVDIVKETLANQNLRVFIWDDDKLVIDSLPLSHEKETSTEEKNGEADFQHRMQPTDSANEGPVFHRESPFENGPDRMPKFDRVESRIFNQNIEHEKIIKQNENYTLFSFESYDNPDEETLCLRGYLPNNRKILVQIPLASIDEAVQISNILLLIVGAAMLIVGIIIVSITSKTITKPIKELSLIAKSMQNLDFSVKYKNSGKDEIAGLGASINALSEKLEQTINELYEKNIKLEQDILLKTRIDNIRKEFIANASHELKTPVALIQGYAEGLDDNIASDEETRRLYTSVITEEAKRMDHIIHQLLDLMEIDGEEDLPHCELFSLSELTKGVIAGFGVVTKTKNIKLVYNADDDCEVWGDYSKIRQAVANYVSNAFNYVDENKLIEITIKNCDDKVLFSVYNTGCQIPEEDINNIWERFYKVDKARTREYGGTGLGLSIVRSVIELHKGEYGVNNRSDGVEFYFTLQKKEQVK